ncbi:hypothetical protein Q8A67_011398 [Cirrhinus molitorella]|uniref:Macro domain-containing protein n=1 Tax=Cirrhinus molitorella TaxID=172907 RepID=A0AA88PV64_9TELE|nr:hypothetical protein Q8A67_011398 [Cirrhinus molitorella]
MSQEVKRAMRDCIAVPGVQTSLMCFDQIYELSGTPTAVSPTGPRQFSKREQDALTAIYDPNKTEKNCTMYRQSVVFCLLSVVVLSRVDTQQRKANSSLLGGGGVDGCIHRAAGHLLYEECHSLNGCDTGKSKITCGYDLPAKYVIHTVGPIARGNLGQTQKDDLEACYKNSLKLMKDNNLRSVAFPCISTGIYGFPNEPAAEIAMKTVREWILDNRDEIDRVIFCVFLETDYEIYKRKMSDFFSPDTDDKMNEKDDSMSQENSEPKEEGEDDHDPDKKGAKDDDNKKVEQGAKDDDKKSEQGAKDDDKKSEQGAKDDDKKSQQGAKDDDKKIQQGGKDDDKSQQGAKDDDKKSQQDEKPDEEMMSQQDESNKDVQMESQDPDESPGAEPMEEGHKPPEKEDPAVEQSPTAEKKLKQESKNEKEKKEGKGEDPQVPGEEKEGSPAKKIQTVPPDELEKLIEDSTKSDNTKMETGHDTQDAMEVENADQSATAAKENNTTSSSSTKEDAKAQDVSSQEPDATQPDTRPKSEDGQGSENAQE